MLGLIAAGDRPRYASNGLTGPDSLGDSMAEVGAFELGWNLDDPCFERDRVTTSSSQCARPHVDAFHVTNLIMTHATAYSVHVLPARRRAERSRSVFAADARRCLSGRSRVHRCRQGVSKTLRSRSRELRFGQRA